MNDDPSTSGSGDQPVQQIQHSSATARVPETVGRGVFATGAIIISNQHELVIDFIQGISNPRRVAARVVLSPAVARQFAAALEGNLGLYAANFGGMPRMPSAAPPPASPQPGPGPAAADPDPPPQGAPAQQPIADVYEQIRLPDEMLGGAYANVVSITHTPSEFCFDFIASVFPRSAVTARVYLAAARVPDVLASLRRSVGPPR